MIFWIVITVLALAASGALGLALARQRLVRPDDPAAYDLKVYRAQLREIEQELDRGVIAPDDADRSRIEISRRILAADARRGAGTGIKGPKLVPAVAVGLVLVAGSLGLYAAIGAPGYGDFALASRIESAEALRESRPGQVQAESQITAPPRAVDPETDALMDRLRETLASNPDDLEGQQIAATMEARLGNYAAAHAAQRQVIALKGAGAGAEDHATFASLLVLAAGGYVSPEAEAALGQALQLDGRNGIALYYLGLMHAQTGRPDLAFGIWERQLRDGPAQAPWMAPIRDQIGSAAAMAGIAFSPPQPGPSAEQVAAADALSDDDRADMIAGMVEGLAARLAEQGGPSGDWARLITSLAVLGETERARAIYDEARQVFAGDAVALNQLQSAAFRAGIGP